MKINRVITRTIVPAILFLAVFGNCKPAPNDPTPQPTLADIIKGKIKGKTYILGSVLYGTTSVTANFTGFKISFNADATSATIYIPSSPGRCEPTIATLGCNIGSSTITFTGTLPSCFPASISNVSAGEEGSSLSFNATLALVDIVITPGRDASVDNYTFNLLKQ